MISSLAMRHISRVVIGSIFYVVSIGWAAAQPRAGVQEQVRAYRVAHEKEIVTRVCAIPFHAKSRVRHFGY
jgi:hypothetical protein